MRPAPNDSEYQLTKNQELGDSQYTEALRALNKKRQKLDTKSPCELSPPDWDGIDFEEGAVSLKNEAARVQTAILACRSCPVLAECEDVLLASLLASQPVTTGVIAGHWVDSSEHGGHISHYLENGEWPEGVSPH